MHEDIEHDHKTEEEEEDKEWRASNSGQYKKEERYTWTAQG